MKFYLAAVLLFVNLTSKAQDYKIENNEVKISKEISFTGKTAELTAESDAAIKTITQYLEDKKYISLLRIESNASAFGDQEKDQKLADARAKAIYQKLIAAGVDCKRLIAVSFGSNKPVADNSTPEGKTANSYIHFVNAALAGHLIGGMPADGGGKPVNADCK